MSPQWIPQNIQKRLLRYVLQQLAIFSDLDLQDLDVSLGKICLQNVLLNPETFQFPGAFLRSGHVDSLELNLTLTDGITINASQTEIIIVLANSNIASNRTDSEEDDKAFSLSHSTADLARSMMVGDEVSNSSDSEDNDDPHSNSSSHVNLNSSNGKKNPTSAANSNKGGQDEKKSSSFYSSYINKAVEMALAKLQLNLSNILIKVIISENQTSMKNDSHFFIDIENISYSSTSSKEIKVSGFKIFTDIDQEERSDDDYVNGSKEEEEEEEEDNGYNKDQHSSDTSEVNSSDEMIQSSFLPNNFSADMYKSSANFSMYQSAHSDLSESAMLTLKHLKNEESKEKEGHAERIQDEPQMFTKSKDEIFESIYMSAISGAKSEFLQNNSHHSSTLNNINSMFKEFNESKDGKSAFLKKYLLSIFNINITFQDILDLKDLIVEIDEFNLSSKYKDNEYPEYFVCLFDVILNVLDKQIDLNNKASKIFRKSTLSNSFPTKKSNLNSTNNFSPPITENDVNPSDPSSANDNEETKRLQESILKWISKFHLSDFNLYFNSNVPCVSKDKETVVNQSDDDFVLNLHNISIMRKTMYLLYGGVQKVTMFNRSSEKNDQLLCFLENSDTSGEIITTDDIKIEYLIQDDKAHISVIISKTLNVNIDLKVVKYFISLFPYLNSMLEKLKEIQLQQGKQKEQFNYSRFSGTRTNHNNVKDISSSIIFQSQYFDRSSSLLEGRRHRRKMQFPSNINDSSYNNSEKSANNIEMKIAVLFQSNNININLNISNTVSKSSSEHILLSLRISPIKFDNSKRIESNDNTIELLSINKVQLIHKDEIILMIKNIQINDNLREISTYDSNNKEVKYLTKLSMSIDSVMSLIGFDDLQELLSSLNKMFIPEILNNINEQPLFDGVNNVSKATNINVRPIQRLEDINAHIIIRKIISKVIHIKCGSETKNKVFGNMVTFVSNFHINLFKDSSIQFLVYHILALRVTNFPHEYNIEYYNGFEDDLKHNDSSSIDNWCLSYAKKNYFYDGVKTNNVEPVISISNPSTISERQLPMIFLKRSPTQSASISSKNGKSKNIAIKGFIRNLKLEYFTSWLEIFAEKTDLCTDQSELVSSVDINEKKVNKSTESCIKLRLVDCIIGLNPLRLNSKSLLVIDKGDADLYFFVNNDDENLIQLQLRNLELLLIDDQKFISCYSKLLQKQDKKNQLSLRNDIYTRTLNNQNPQIDQSQLSWHLSTGFKSVGTLDSLNISIIQKSNEKLLKMPGSLKAIQDMKINIGTLQVGLCADSSQALLSLLSDLKVPIIVSDKDKYNVSVNDEKFNLFKDVEEDTFGINKVPDDTEIISDLGTDEEISDIDSEDSEVQVNSHQGNENESGGSLHFVDNFYKQNNPYKNSNLSSEYISDSNHIPRDNIGKYASSESTLKSSAATSESPLSFANDYFNADNSILQGENNAALTKIVPFKLNVILNKARIFLYDGYDWKSTRKAIRNKVRSVENIGMKEFVKQVQQNTTSETNRDNKKDISNRRDSLGDFGFRPFNSNNRKTIDDDDDDDNDNIFADGVINEALFGSIHITLPAGADPGILSRQINQTIGYSSNYSEDDQSIHSDDLNNREDDLLSSSKPNDPVKFKTLRLRRSKYHKIKVDISDLEVNFTLFSDDNNNDRNEFVNGAVYSSILGENDSKLVSVLNIKVDDFVIHDNLPTSTWNKFATYMRDAGARETGVSILDFNLDVYKPIKALPATEAVVSVHVLPLRLHVDQDALEFLKRFGGFKDKRFLFDPIYDEILYIQKFEVNTIPIKLDYKPKKLNLVGIRSGDTSELINIFILEGAKILLKKVKVFGIPGFDKLNDVLNSLWMPDITQTQITGIMHGLAPSLMKLGEGVKDLIVVPINEYKREGRIVSSLQKGAFAFVKTTGNEILKFGVKVSVGTQAILENTEGMLGGVGSNSRLPNDTIGKFSDEENDMLDIERLDAAGNKELYRQLKVEARKKNHGMQTSLYVTNDSTNFNNGNVEKGGRYYTDVFSDSEDDLVLNDDDTNISGDDEFDLDDNDPEAVDNDDFELQKAFSLYADQPQNMQEGINKAYSSFGRNFNIAKKTVIDASEKVGESKGAKNAFTIMAKAAPVAIMRPLIGTTEAISKTLIGLTNQIDPKERLKANDKYKPMR